MSSKCPVLNIVINVYEWKFKEEYMTYECRENISANVGEQQINLQNCKIQKFQVNQVVNC